MVPANDAVPSPSPAITIDRVTPAEAEVAAAVLVRAFGDDPFWNAWGRNCSDAVIAAGMRQITRTAMRSAAAAGDVWIAREATGSAIAGVAWCYRETGDGAALTAIDWSEAERAWGAEAFGRIMNAVESLAELSERTCPAPVMQLELLAVDPVRQGLGIGGLLMNRVHQRAREAGLPVRLDTFNRRTVTFYERNGMTVISKAFQPVMALPFWIMWSTGNQGRASPGKRIRRGGTCALPPARLGRPMPSERQSKQELHAHQHREGTGLYKTPSSTCYVSGQAGRDTQGCAGTLSRRGR